MTLATQWLALVATTLPITLLFELQHLPAGTMLGPMIGAIIFVLLRDDGSPADASVTAGPGAPPRPAVPRWVQAGAQGLLGCLIAQRMPLNSLAGLGHAWPGLLVGVVSVSVFANVLGWLLARWQVLPGTVAVWGSAPGAASVMVLIAQEDGADYRLVAFMQYLRVVCVSLVASLVGRIVMAPKTSAPADASEGEFHAPLLQWLGDAMHFAFPPIHPSLLAVTLGVGFGGAWLGRRLRIPVGQLLVPLVLGIALHATTGIEAELPPWLMAGAYVLFGWSIGLSFSRQILRVAWRSLPRVLVAIVMLVLCCAGLAVALSRWLQIDLLTAYLATSPGGLDSVAIISASSPVDVGFVMSMQILRFVFVLLTGPTIARFVARHVPDQMAGSRRS